MTQSRYQAAEAMARLGNSKTKCRIHVKTKIKVSGCFRSMEGASNYLGVMSYLSTARKHGIGPHKAMAAAFDGKPDIVL